MVVYYLCPKKWQWIVLLCCSFIYYFLAATAYTIIFLLISSIIAYLSAIIIEVQRENGRLILYITLVSIVINVGIWFAVKGSQFWVSGSRFLNGFFHFIPVLHPLPIVSALGMGYYTAQVIGYILDVYWDNIKPQHNPAKIILFVSFFPQLTVGPISRYNDLDILFKPHLFSYKNLCFGSQRILWGLYKKIVISDRVGIIVNGIWSDTVSYNGVWLWIAVFLYPIQIYTDFSGCMDIVLGAAELFDIPLRENFRNPFFARNSQEFWQRWHITLGTWARDYVYYPVLKSKFLINLGRQTKKRFGKRLGKFIPWSLGMAVLWFVMGFWHGSMQHIVGVSLWFWLMLILAELLEPLLCYLIKTFSIRTEALSWHIFQSFRTYLVYSVGAVAFSAVGLSGALKHYGLLITSFKSINPWVLFDGSILNLGVTWRDINLIIIGVFLLLIVAILRERFDYARVWIQKQNVGFRWLIWYGLFLMVLVFGLYGEGYDASTFIYQGF